VKDVPPEDGRTGGLAGKDQDPHLQVLELVRDPGGGGKEPHLGDDEKAPIAIDLEHPAMEEEEEPHPSQGPCAQPDDPDPRKDKDQARPDRG